MKPRTRSTPSGEVRGTAAVIGAGMAGTAAAYRLRQQGFRTTLFEERDRVGGRIWSVRRGDFLMDLGTAVYLGTYRRAIELIQEVGLTSELSEVPATLGMTREGRQYHLDLGHPIRSSLTTGALMLPQKARALRLMTDVARHRNSLGYDDYSGLSGVDDETVREYCRRVLGEDLLQHLGRPLVSGTWVADDEETSVSLLFWTVRNMLVKSVFNLGSGVVGLPRALAGLVDTRLSTSVRNVTDTVGGVQVTYSGPDGVERVEDYDACVVATTAQPAMKVFPQMDENHRDLYGTTRYRRLGSVSLGLSRRPANPATFFLIAPQEDPGTIAVISDHLKAPGRAPAGKGLVTVLLSHEYLESNEHLTDEQVLEEAVARASRYYGDIAGDVEQHMVVRWPESVPVLQRGRFRQMTTFRKRLDPTARVQFAGDLDRIPGLNGALVSGEQAALRIGRALL